MRPHPQRQELRERKEKEDGTPDDRDRAVDDKLAGLGHVAVVGARVLRSPKHAQRGTAETEEAKAGERDRDGVLCGPIPSHETRHAEQREE
jgi:hypothetical protein